MEPSLQPSFTFPSRKDLVNRAFGLKEQNQLSYITTRPEKPSDISIETGLHPSNTVPPVLQKDTLDPDGILPIAENIYVQPGLAEGMTSLTQQDMTSAEIMRVLSSNNALKRGNYQASEFILNRPHTVEEIHNKTITPNTRPSERGGVDLHVGPRTEHLGAPTKPGPNYQSMEQMLSQYNNSIEDMAKHYGIDPVALTELKTRFNIFGPAAPTGQPNLPAGWKSILEMIRRTMEAQRSGFQPRRPPPPPGVGNGSGGGGAAGGSGPSAPPRPGGDNQGPGDGGGYTPPPQSAPPIFSNPAQPGDSHTGPNPGGISSAPPAGDYPIYRASDTVPPGGINMGAFPQVPTHTPLDMSAFPKVPTHKLSLPNTDLTPTATALQKMLAALKKAPKPPLGQGLEPKANDMMSVLKQEIASKRQSIEPVEDNDEDGWDQDEEMEKPAGNTQTDFPNNNQTIAQQNPSGEQNTAGEAFQGGDPGMDIETAAVDTHMIQGVTIQNNEKDEATKVVDDLMNRRTKDMLDFYQSGAEYWGNAREHSLQAAERMPHLTDHYRREADIQMEEQIDHISKYNKLYNSIPSVIGTQLTITQKAEKALSGGSRPDELRNRMGSGSDHSLTAALPQMRVPSLMGDWETDPSVIHERELYDERMEMRETHERRNRSQDQENYFNQIRSNHSREAFEDDEKRQIIRNPKSYAGINADDHINHKRAKFEEEIVRYSRDKRARESRVDAPLSEHLTNLDPNGNIITAQVQQPQQGSAHISQAAEDLINVPERRVMPKRGNQPSTYDETTQRAAKRMNPGTGGSSAKKNYNGDGIRLPFGKHYVHMPKLFYNGELSLSNANGRKVSRVKNEDVVRGSGLHKALCAMAEGATPNLKKLSVQEKQRLHHISARSSIRAPEIGADINVNPMQQIAIVMGEIDAGNNNPKLRKQLQQLLHYAQQAGQLSADDISSFQAEYIHNT